MRHNLSKTIILLLVLILSASCLFAASASENEQEDKFLSLDMENSSFKEIMQAYEESMQSYDEKCQHLTEQMGKYYKAGNVEDYIVARNMKRDLAYPSFTKDDVEILSLRLQNETDEEAKAGFSAWLYKNCRYYRPTITLEIRSTYQTSRYSISVEPGTTVTLPKLRYRSRTQTFLGWGSDEETVTYAEGDEITMPYTDLVLYGVFTSNETEEKTEGNDVPVVTVKTPVE